MISWVLRAVRYFKYFTYDTYDKDTWGSLDGLEACMRSVKGHDWIKGADLWEDHKELLD